MRGPTWLLPAPPMHEVTREPGRPPGGREATPPARPGAGAASPASLCSAAALSALPYGESQPPSPSPSPCGPAPSATHRGKLVLRHAVALQHGRQHLAAGDLEGGWAMSSSFDSARAFDFGSWVGVRNGGGKDSRRSHGPGKQVRLESRPRVLQGGARLPPLDARSSTAHEQPPCPWPALAAPDAPVTPPQAAGRGSVPTAPARPP
jgi:hypothetical protein